MIKKPKNLVFLIICFGLVFLIYGQTLFGDFVFDDRSIVQHRFLLANINNLFKIVSLPYWTEEAGLYRPLTLITYSFNYVFFGQAPFSFHLVNLIFYALTGYLLFLFIERIFAKKGLAYLTALLFLVLPIHTEAVANIVGRSEIFALFFSLLTFLELLKEKPSPLKIAGWSLLAVLSKETAIALLPISLPVLFLKEKKPAKEIFKKYFSSLSALAIAVSIYLTGRFFVLGLNFFSNNATLVENPLKFASFSERIAAALKILVLYLQKTFWPFPLCADYSYNQIPVLSGFFNLETLAGLAVFLFFVLSSVLFFGRAPVLALASAFFLFGFLPVSNLVFPIGTIAGERLVYFSSIGLALYLGQSLFFLSRLKPKKFFSLIFLLLSFSLLSFYGSRSFMRNFDWLTEKSLFTSMVQCAPKSVLAHTHLGAAYYLEGKYDEAEQEILAGQKIYDKYSKAINNLSLIYWKKGQFDKAKAEYFRALKNYPPYEGLYENLALLYLSQGQEKQAERWLRISFPGSR